MKRNGIYEWIFQRFSTILITVYSIVYISLFLSIETYDYATWTTMHSVIWFKVYSTITLIIIMANSLLAGWQIGTDYTQKVPLLGFSTLFHSFYTLVTIGLLAFGLYILWLL
ncbi:succinate dehydrogenase, hydrophobic membrane anchor protein [Pseudoalteromonas sp. NBT06-2]|uniref:succinate dehydrogenase, hydrophobic membrane anchor protein n=1 Tax=Pseudoalteromonas sp. NBT06-2 TaxID=2025950 RepID=UPI000BA6D87D|nr:succinate dehydrogenase, hydrophobic membrane anchor protein [Pseudoalteromonas sp. NBT06-2]PAJ76311.1 succinate dehydrogenase, hydrophobic membrane anchor protein [Pseudoalteromonas sp. NBT06-2]